MLRSTHEQLLHERAVGEIGRHSMVNQSIRAYMEFSDQIVAELRSKLAKRDNDLASIRGRVKWLEKQLLLRDAQ